MYSVLCDLSSFPLISGWVRRLNERLSRRGEEVCVQLMSETHYGPADFERTLRLADIDIQLS